MAAFYGKMPAKADFVSRFADRDVIGALDQWFQDGLTQSQDSLGPDWLAHYQVAPIWRYYLSPGVVDENAWAGVWIASIDKVNRNFPMTLFAIDGHPANMPVDVLGYTDWFLQAEDLLCTIHEDEFDFDRFCSAVEAWPAPQPGPVPGPASASLSDQVFKLNLDEAVTAVLQQMADRIEQLEARAGISGSAGNPAQSTGELVPLQNLATSPVLREKKLAAVPDHCVWLSDGNEHIGEQLVVTSGLPSPADFVKFLTGF